MQHQTYESETHINGYVLCSYIVGIIDEVISSDLSNIKCFVKFNLCHFLKIQMLSTMPINFIVYYGRILYYIAIYKILPHTQLYCYYTFSGLE